MNSQPSTAWHCAPGRALGLTLGLQDPAHLAQPLAHPRAMEETLQNCQVCARPWCVARHPRSTSQQCGESSIILLLKSGKTNNRNPPASFNTNQIQKPQEKAFPLCASLSGPETPMRQDKGHVGPSGLFQRVGTHPQAQPRPPMASPARAGGSGGGPGSKPGTWRSFKAHATAGRKHGLSRGMIKRLPIGSFPFNCLQ